MARRGRKLTVEWAAADDAAGLYERYRRERRPDVRPRLHGLWLVRTGKTTREASEVLGRGRADGAAVAGLVSGRWAGAAERRAMPAARGRRRS